MITKRAFLCVTAIAVVMMAGSVNAQLVGQLGILDLTANDGINPATGNAWQAGDNYRFVFASSGTTQATSTDINDYNMFVQDAANASPLNIGATQEVTWKAIASTDDIIENEVVVSEGVDARDNTATDPNVHGTGEAIFLLDGETYVAEDYTILWGGSDSHSSSINVSETGGAPAPTPNGWGQTWTGTSRGAYPAADYGVVDPENGLGAANGTARDGLYAFTSGTHWIYRFTGPTTTERPLYGLSEPLTVGGGSSSFIDGDYNSNDQVEQGDLDLVLLNWGNLVPPAGGTVPDGWTNPDFPPTPDAIDQDDLDGVLLNWGNTPAVAAAGVVPEPASACLLLIGGLGLGRLRRNS